MNTSKEIQRQYRSKEGCCICYSVIHRSKTSYSLVMLHGVASNQTRWSEFLSQTKLKDHANTLRLDLRGHGCSLSYEPVNHAVWQKDLQGILQQESLQNIILLGHSMGAQLALNYAVAFPEQVAGLVLIDPTFPDKIRGALGIARRLRYLIKAIIFLLKFKIRFMPEKIIYPYLDLQKLDQKTREHMVTQGPDVIVDLYTSPSEDLKYLPLINYLQDIYASTAPLPDLSMIRCPVKILVSRSSAVVSTGNIEPYFPGCKDLEVTEIEANHWPLTEKPEDTRQAIDDWCLKLITE